MRNKNRSASKQQQQKKKKTKKKKKKKIVRRRTRAPRKAAAPKNPSRREERAAAEAKIGERYRTLQSDLTERARRLFVASEAIAFGHGGIASAARATGMAPSSIGKGIREVRALEDGTAKPMDPTRSRRPGGGRKKATEKDPTLLADLKVLVESTTRGDPESPLLWTARSQRNIVDALEKQGHQTSMKIVSRLLKELGYSGGRVS